MPEQFNQSQDGSKLKITEIRVIEEAGERAPNVVITKGKTFKIELDIEYTELLGDVGAEVDITICVNEICNGSSQPTYEQSGVYKLEKDSTSRTVTFSGISAAVKGIFKLHSGAVVKTSEIAAYMEGPIIFVIEA